jgi:hypothetical protein
LNGTPLESFFEDLWRESGAFDFAHRIVTGITDTWYGLPVAVLCALAVLGIIFRLTQKAERKSLERRAQDGE